MIKINNRYFLLLSLLTITISACTQPRTTVELRGHESFKRNNDKHYQYAESSPVDSLKISELEPAAGAFPKENNSLGNNSDSGDISISDIPPPSVSSNASLPDSTEKNTPDKLSKDSLIWPISSRNIIVKFGSPTNGSGKSNEGINILAEEGEPVWAVANGEVVYVDDKLKTYGKMVIVKHQGGSKNLTTTYAHLARYAVEKYDRVKQGDIIGYVGSSGNAKKPQLYFSLRKDGKFVDPALHLDRKTVSGI